MLEVSFCEVLDNVTWFRTILPFGEVGYLPT